MLKHTLVYEVPTIEKTKFYLIFEKKTMLQALIETKSYSKKIFLIAYITGTIYLNR